MKQTETNSEPVYLSETEGQLALDADGALREDLLKTLISEAMKLKQQQEGGLSPEAFELNQSMITGILASAEVVDTIWLKYHSK